MERIHGAFENAAFDRSALYFTWTSSGSSSNSSGSNSNGRRPRERESSAAAARARARARADRILQFAKVRMSGDGATRRGATRRAASICRKYSRLKFER